MEKFPRVRKMMLLELVGRGTIATGTKLSFLKEDGEHMGVYCDKMPASCFKTGYKYEYEVIDRVYEVEVLQKRGDSLYIEYTMRTEDYCEAKKLFNLLKANNEVEVTLYVAVDYTLDDIPYTGTKVMEVSEQTVVIAEEIEE